MTSYIRTAESRGVGAVAATDLRPSAMAMPKPAIFAPITAHATGPAPTEPGPPIVPPEHLPTTQPQPPTTSRRRSLLILGSTAFALWFLLRRSR